MVGANAASLVPVSQKLNVLAPWRWLVDLHPNAVWVACFIISPGMLWVNDILFVYGRLVPPNQQWVSAQFDIALALAAAIMVTVLRSAEASRIPSFVRDRRVHWMLVLCGFAVAFIRVWQEKDAVTTWERRLGPNSLYHNILLYPFLVYLLGLLFLATFVFIMGGGYRQQGYTMAYSVIFVLIASWAAAVVYDGSHQYAPGGTPKAVIANPPDPWCGGLLTERLCGPAER